MQGLEATSHIENFKDLLLKSMNEISELGKKEFENLFEKQLISLSQNEIKIILNSSIENSNILAENKTSILCTQSKMHDSGSSQDFTKPNITKGMVKSSYSK